jgi:ABC-2 type transport system ATP-binding protein
MFVSELALDLHQLCKTYDRGVQALDGVSLQVAQGDFFALLGANGAGKSTMIGIVATLVKKTSGIVRVFGWDLDTHAVQVKKSIGLVAQEFNFSLFEKVEDILIQQAGYYGVPSNEQVSI